ncbi:MAG: ABC transporter ATP-binding protein [Erysipelotrichaceae bacterium]|nr:ABC transporter ATP-binding protein [Erysipelotrichaceae bacterium]MBR2701887.1 ABC transporter ATP-binding protein [Erysipelotrichaceae bacterium]
MDKNSGNKVLQYIKKHALAYLIGIGINLGVDYLNLFIPQFTGEITDGLTAHTIDSAAIASTVWKLILVSFLLACGRFAYRQFIIGSSRKIERALQNDIFRKLETLSQRYFNLNKTGDLMAYFTNDLEAIREAIGWSVISAADALVMTLMCLYRMMVYVNVRLTLYVMVPMICIGFYGFFIFKQFDKKYEAKQESFAKLSDEVQESISAERVIKAFVQEEKQLDHFKVANGRNRDINMTVVRLRAYAWPVLEVFISVAYVIAILVGGYYTLINVITLGKFVTFASYVGTLVWPMLAFGDCINMFTLGYAGMKRINKVFDEIPEITDSENPDDVTELTGEIEFDHVSFRYENDLPEALHDIDFKIRKGETFAIMGRTGAGKTTVVNLITRLFDVTDGEIRLDGHAIKQIPLKVLRENIAYVPQDNFMFSETLKQNISFGKQEATMDEIIEMCKMADVHDNIEDFPLKYETVVGERGVTLSGGQKQRASIARALLKESPILIMDDSLSAVDTDTEEHILSNLKKLRAGKTTIMIAHRVSTVQNADHILVLDDGKAIEYGTYDELVALDGDFARMVRKQQLEKQLAMEGEV